MALRVGIVGAGNIGRIHARMYASDALADLVGVADVVPEKAAALATLHGARPFSSLEALIEAGIDVLSVTTAGAENGGDHYAPAMEAITAGVNVLCEKPLSNELARARELVATAQAKGVYLGVNLNHRFVPMAARARQWLDEGRLGELSFVNMALWIRNPNESSPWFHLRALHPHSIDVMRYFAGDVVRVQAFMKMASHRKIWSTCSVNLLFANGAVGHLTGSYDMTTRHPIERCEVAGTKGRFVLENVMERLTLYPHDSDELTVVEPTMMGGSLNFDETFKNRIHRFLEQVSEKAPREQLDGSGEEAVAAQAVIEAAIESWETGKVVDVG